MKTRTVDMGKWQMKVLFVAALLLVGGFAIAAPVIIDFDDTLPTYVGLDTYQEDGFTLTSNVPSGTLIDVNNIVRQNIGIFSGGTDSQSLLTLTGSTAGGGTVSQTLALNGDLASYNITGLGLVTNLVLSFDGTVDAAPFDIDNINLNVVPVPAAVWLFASALGMLGWVRRRVKC